MHKPTTEDLERRIKSLEDELTMHRLESQMLMYSTEKYKDLFDNANDAIFIVDSNLNYTEVNRKAVELFGYSKEEFLNMKITDLIPPEQLPHSNKEFDKLKKNGRYEKFIGKLRTKNGRWLDIEVSSSAIMHNGRYIGSRDIVRDITDRIRSEQELERHRLHLEDLVEERTTDILKYARKLEKEIAERRSAEKELEKLREELQQKQKIEAIGALAGGIAHDFNNVLNAILSYAELAIVMLPPDDKVHSYMDKIIQSIQRAGGLVQQILTFSSRKDATDQIPMHLQPLVKEELKLIRDTLPENIKLRLNVEPQCQPVLGNFIQLHQVIMNIATNAVKAMSDKGGTLTVSLQELELDRKTAMQHPGLKPLRYACLSFQDTGPGMDRETVTRIFEPYFTTRKFGAGTGLGLATVQSIVRNHGGECIVESTPGQGTTFHVYFPIINQVLPTASPLTDRKISPTRTGTIMLVDDEKIIVEAVQIALRQYGHTVESFTNSCHALKAFQDAPDKYDLVVTDHKMPGITGAELAQRLLDIRKEIPVILATGYSEHLNEQKAKDLGIREFVMKPISMADLASIISKLIDAR